jgi:hypothetical protein
LANLLNNRIWIGKEYKQSKKVFDYYTGMPLFLVERQQRHHNSRN